MLNQLAKALPFWKHLRVLTLLLTLGFSTICPTFVVSRHLNALLPTPQESVSKNEQSPDLSGDDEGLNFRAIVQNAESHNVSAPFAGTVSHVAFAQWQNVEQDQLLLLIESAEKKKSHQLAERQLQVLEDRLASSNQSVEEIRRKQSDVEEKVGQAEAEIGRLQQLSFPKLDRLVWNDLLAGTDRTQPVSIKSNIATEMSEFNVRGSVLVAGEIHLLSVAQSPVLTALATGTIQIDASAKQKNATAAVGANLTFEAMQMLEINGDTVERSEVQCQIVLGTRLKCVRVERSIPLIRRLVEKRLRQEFGAKKPLLEAALCREVRQMLTKRLDDETKKIVNTIEQQAVAAREKMKLLDEQRTIAVDDLLAKLDEGHKVSIKLSVAEQYLRSVIGQLQRETAVAKASLRTQLQSTANATEIRSPAAGVILQSSVQPGELVQQGQLIAVVGNQDRLKAFITLTASQRQTLGSSIVAWIRTSSAEPWSQVEAHYLDRLEDKKDSGDLEINITAASHPFIVRPGMTIDVRLQSLANR